MVKFLKSKSLVSNAVLMGALSGLPLLADAVPVSYNFNCPNVNSIILNISGLSYIASAPATDGMPAALENWTATSMGVLPNPYKVIVNTDTGPVMTSNSYGVVCLYYIEPRDSSSPRANLGLMPAGVRSAYTFSIPGDNAQIKATTLH